MCPVDKGLIPVLVCSWEILLPRDWLFLSTFSGGNFHGDGDFLELQPPRQTFCLAQTPEFLKSCSSTNAQKLDSNIGDFSLIAPVPSSINMLPCLQPHTYNK
jgi:hypothetical protein